MIEIKNLEGISFEQIYTAFKSAFSDYEISVDKTELNAETARLQSGFIIRCIL